MNFKNMLIEFENKIGDVFKKYKIVLIWTFIIMALTHIYFFVGRFVNEDMLGYLSKAPAELGSGRYFYGNAEFSILPIVIFMIIFVEVALAVILVINLFEVDKTVYGIIIAALMVTFPSWSYSFGYIFMWDSYSLALLTAVFAVFCADRYKYGFFAGGGILACCLALYQAYIAVSVTLIFLLLIFEFIENDFKVALKKVIRFLLLGVLGFVIYKVGIWFFDIELSSYKGADSMGYIPIDMIPSLIERTYKNFIHFFTGNNFGVKSIRFFYVPFVVAIMYFICIVFTLFMLCSVLKEKKIKTLNTVVVAGLVFLMPMAVNFVDFAAAQASASNLNSYAFVFVFIFSIILFVRYQSSSNAGKNKYFFSKRILIVFSFIIIGYNFWLSNAYYQKLDVITENTKSFESRLLGRFEQLEGFNINTKFTIMADNYYLFDKHVRQHWGNFPYIVNDQGNYGFYITGLRDLNKANYKTRMLMKNLLGVELNTASGEEIEDIKNTEEYKSMGVYPAFDSVKMINGIAVVNFVDNSKSEESRK